MYLKSIEVQGFKSFANRIVFEFHNGITGIVGPNGSGKSNVGDAVRWVLGEQSAKQLRGARMEDVIFSGTELRKPVSYAFVSITLDNTDRALNIDFDEVTVTRKVFRSGESGYMINGSNCRLKDINELFYDTGIGKEGYSIIGQGQIDKILSGKPEERRELFDEAAGIVKFKRRKNEAVKKLESEEANLVRITDILSELEKQVGPLEKQAEKARKYLQLKEDLKKYDVNQFLLETEKIKEQLDTVTERFDNVSNELEQGNRDFEDIRAEYDRIEAEIGIINHSIEESAARQNETTLLKGKLEGEINVLNEQINTLMVNDEHINERIEAVQRDVAAKEGSLRSFEEEKAALLSELDEQNEKLADADRGKKFILDRISEQNQAVENGKDEIIQVLNEKGQVRSRAERYEAMLEQIQIRKSELTGKILKGRSDEESWQVQLDAYEARLAQVNGEIEALNKTNDELAQEIAATRAFISDRTNDVNKKQQEYHSQKSRLESLRNITERYDGYGNSIRKVMELKDGNDGILGVIADIIKVEKKYEIAIETALGGAIQNIVTDNEATAKDLIQYLKDNKLGRATFLPLSAISGRNTLEKEPVLKEPGVVGIASNLVKVSFEYVELSRYLLGRVLVVDQIDHALAIARKYKYSLRIVTLEGEQLSPGGSMTGGAFKNTSNLLGRRREIEELSAQIKEISSRINEWQEEIKNQRGILTSLRESLDENNKTLRDKMVERNTAQMNVAQAQEKKQEIVASYSDSRKESQEIDGQIADIRASLAGIDDEIQSLEQRKAAAELAVEENTRLLEATRKEEAEYNSGTQSLHLKVQELTQRISFVQENIDRVQGEMEQLVADIAELDGRRGQSRQEIAEKRKSIEIIRLNITDAIRVMEEHEQKLNVYKAQREEKNKTHKSFFEKREALQKTISELDKEKFRLSGQLEKLNENNDALYNYMWNEYEITLSVALPMRDETLTDLADIKKNINLLKASIRNLGDVNVNAIEDYRNVSERYGFLRTQHDDLVEAKESLTKIIEELDTGMRTQFMEKFQQIKQEFDKVFKELFGGGRGTIELVEDEDILEAGIRIISQPPGKKLQNMMQLSGGEKALTAISLLFAIQNLKPSPFCLLDEIEAALDDSNVTRFAQYLHKLTKHTQFIVITHRRGTMAAADRLYGITMQEKGVSTLVSVDLIEKELDKDEKKE